MVGALVRREVVRPGSWRLRCADLALGLTRAYLAEGKDSRPGIISENQIKSRL